MRRTFLAWIVLLLLAGPALRAEDAQLRRQAVELISRAYAVSTLARFPDLERIDNFRFITPESGEQQGSFARKVIQGKGRRDEYSLPGYHAVLVATHGAFNIARTSDTLPEAFEELMTVVPVRLLHFDEEDVIHGIIARPVEGRPAHCVEFATVAGNEVQPENEICVDDQNGAMVFEKVGVNTTENLEFFEFAGSLIPARIRYSMKGSVRLEVQQTVRPLTEPEGAVLALPKDALPYTVCHNFREPIGIDMPLPKKGSGSGDYYVKVHGFVHPDGKVHDAVVQYSSLAALNQEALDLVSRWNYTTPMCEGKPNSQEVFIELHFEGR